MKNSKYSRILDNVLDEKVPHDHQLAPQILAKLQKNKGANMSKRIKVLVPILTVMLAVLLFTVPAVAQAIQRWIGYVPGFGLVNEGSVRVIDQPVVITQDGVNLTVTQVTSSSKKTVIKYNFQPIPAEARDDTRSCRFPDDVPTLILSDGTTPVLQAVGWEADESIYFSELTFDGIPDNITDMTLIINCVQQTLPGSVPWDWSVPLSFDPLKPTLTMAPVFEVPGATKQPEVANTEVNAKLDVNQIIPLTDGYILSGNMSVETVSDLTVEESDRFLEDMEIKDANNVALTTARVPEDFIIEGNFEDKNQFNWAVQISGKQIAWPLTITVNSLRAITSPYALSTFVVDVGSDPQLDQVWEINQAIPLGPKFVQVVSLQRVKDSYGFDGYKFTFLYDSSLELSFDIMGASPNGGGGGGSEEIGGPVIVGRSYAGNVPTGILTIELNGYGIDRIHGPWQVSVDKPVLP
jgi:hypothetical protein